MNDSRKNTTQDSNSKVRRCRDSRTKKNARQLVQKELAVMKDEIKNLKMGSGSIVCSEASAGMGLGSGTFARPPPLTSRWNELFIPRKMEFKGWVTDSSKASLQGVTDDEVAKLLGDLERTVPQQAHKVDWLGPNQARNKEQGRGKFW